MNCTTISSTYIHEFGVYNDTHYKYLGKKIYANDDILYAIQEGCAVRFRCIILLTKQYGFFTKEVSYHYDAFCSVISQKSTIDLIPPYVDVIGTIQAVIKSNVIDHYQKNFADLMNRMDMFLHDYEL